jgi:hypothetical protein
MKITLTNPQKGHHEVYKITDFEECLLISQFGYCYPILIYEKSRAAICYDKDKARDLIDLHE